MTQEPVLFLFLDKQIPSPFKVQTPATTIPQAHIQDIMILLGWQGEQSREFGFAILWTNLVIKPERDGFSIINIQVKVFDEVIIKSREFINRWKDPFKGSGLYLRNTILRWLFGENLICWYCYFLAQFIIFIKNFHHHFNKK